MDKNNADLAAFHIKTRSRSKFLHFPEWTTDFPFSNRQSFLNQKLNLSTVSFFLVIKDARISEHKLDFPASQLY